ncbi:MAG: hypothetical protein NTY15_17620 [Planctomycetota bacterium]|nr:hypothetical protein [Planctomycetota bacterium]
MISSFAKTALSRAFFACFVVSLASLGFTSNASASCGDYLRHNTIRISKSFSLGDVRDGLPGKLPAPSTGCKNGKCGEAPPVVPVESSRISKLDANHLNSEFLFAHGMTDTFEFLNDKPPLQPTLDLRDPPPRTLAP